MNIVKNILFGIIEPLAMRKLHIASGIYREKKYHNILSVYNRHVKPIKKSCVYQNIFRIACLINTNDEQWESEYLSLLENNHLDFFHEDDQKYIQQFLTMGLPPNSNYIRYSAYDLKKVSRTTKKLFITNENHVDDGLISFKSTDL